MADFTIDTISTKKINGFAKSITLNAGEKLSSDAQLVAIANKTVPAGYKVTATVFIQISNIETV